MKKRDKLNKIKGYVVHCKTNDDAKLLCSKLHEKGYKWGDGGTYDSKTNWNIYKENTCYNPYEGLFARLEYYKTRSERDHDYKIFIVNVNEFLNIL